MDAVTDKAILTTEGMINIMVDSNDKRDFMRLAVNCPIEITRVDSKQTVAGIAKNISAAGVLFTSDHEFCKGDRVHIKLVPEQVLVQDMDAEVEVIRVRVLGMDQGFEVACIMLQVEPLTDQNE